MPDRISSDRPTARLMIGDVFARLAELPDDSVDLILTSPPFLALRSYLPDNHPDKDKEIGSEPDPATFIDTMLALTAQWERVLAPHGSLVVELGDTYAGSGGSGGDYNKNGQREGQNKVYGSKRRQGDWPLNKSLCGIPELYALSLIYGRNMLTGQQSTTGQWRVRNTIAWVRPNPTVGALGDKFRPAKSLMTIACKHKTRWFDIDAARKINDDGTLGAPPFDWWNVATVPYRGSHFAVWPPRLLQIPIETMCPRHVCRTCGIPPVRASTTEYRDRKGDIVTPNKTQATSSGRGGHQQLRHATSHVKFAGWSDCGHDNYRRGIVLDPFAGSGTTLMVATQRGRDAIGIEINGANATLVRQRVGDNLIVDIPSATS